MISSISNPQMKHILALQKKSRYRKDEQQFVAEGLRMVMETPGERLKKLYVSERFIAQAEDQIQTWVKMQSWELVSDNVFNRISQTQTPQGILAVVGMSSPGVDRILENGDNKCYLLLESLQDPGNLGTILRTAEAAGIDGIILNETSVDIYNPKVIRSTMGALYRMPFAYTTDLRATIKQMKKAGIKVFAAHLAAAKNYDQADYHQGCAFLIGNEANGLSDEIAALATEYIKIPMSGSIESLNASVAAALLMYEARRQRVSGK